MKLILSRKGFDSSAGGCPNPIFPDGSMLALPIPDTKSSVRYRDLKHHLPSGEVVEVSDLVSQLTKGKIKPAVGAHLDPDMIASAYSREPNWRPVLGQTGAAQGHLAKQAVGVGDVFLFFGLFRSVELYKEGRKKARWRFVPGSKSKHVLWGWLEIGEKLIIDQTEFSSSESDHLKWLAYHPHLHGEPDANNTLYLSSTTSMLDDFVVDGLNSSGSVLNNKKPGHGVFSKVTDELVLTHPESLKPSFWQLPEWFYPFLSSSSHQQGDREPLSYHHKPNRWYEPSDGYCQLQSAARGQEFVLDVDHYPEAKTWLAGLIQRNS